VPDAVGQRHCPLGTVVSFIVKERSARNPFHTRLGAIDVRKVRSRLDENYLVTRREIGTVKSVNARLGVLTRANRIDLIDFRPASLGPDLRYTVKAGDRLEFSVVRKEVVTDTGDINIQVYATNLCIAPSEEVRELAYVPGSIEEYFLKVSEQQPLEK
jgi:hypothetical protein